MPENMELISDHLLGGRLSLLTLSIQRHAHSYCLLDNTRACKLIAPGAESSARNGISQSWAPSGRENTAANLDRANNSTEAKSGSTFDTYTLLSEARRSAKLYGKVSRLASIIRQSSAATAGRITDHGSQR